MVRDLTTKSLRILFRAVPRWIGELVYGGPSCSTNVGAPTRASWIRWYSPAASHAANIAGSAFIRSAFIGIVKFGSGRFREAFKSIGGEGVYLWAWTSQFFRKPLARPLTSLGLRSAVAVL